MREVVRPDCSIADLRRQAVRDGLEPLRIGVAHAEHVAQHRFGLHIGHGLAPGLLVTHRVVAPQRLRRHGGQSGEREAAIHAHAVRHVYKGGTVALDGVDLDIERGRIIAVEERADRAGAIVVDMGDLTALPGFIDTHVRLPRDVDPSLGPLLLAFGLTTLVADTNQADALNAQWSGKAIPGPLVLGDDWLLDLESVAAMNISVDSLPTSPMGIRYEDAQISDTSNPATVVSGLADSRTPGLAELLQSRQSRLLRGYPTALRRYTEAPSLAAQSTSIVLGSAANGLPPGVGLHAELRALGELIALAEDTEAKVALLEARAIGTALQLSRVDERWARRHLTVTGLRTVLEPVDGPLVVDLDDRRVLPRLVSADDLDEPPVAQVWVVTEAAPDHPVVPVFTYFNLPRI